MITKFDLLNEQYNAYVNINKNLKLLNDVIYVLKAQNNLISKQNELLKQQLEEMKKGR